MSSKASRSAKVGEEAPETPRRQSAAHSDDEASDHDLEVMTPVKVSIATPLARVSTPLAVDGDAEKLVEQRREVARLENMIQDAQHNYESTIREHLQKLQKGSLDVDSRRFPELYANVRKWQEQLEPVLREFDTRPDFNIHDYSTTLLASMANLPDSERTLLPFARLVEGHPRWEVCRRFLTTLLLTNQGNTDILFDGEEERINHFKVKLLKAERKMISLQEDEIESAKPPLTSGRPKKSEAQIAAQEDGARRKRKGSERVAEPKRRNVDAV